MWERCYHCKKLNAAFKKLKKSSKNLQPPPLIPCNQLLNSRDDVLAYAPVINFDDNPYLGVELEIHLPKTLNPQEEAIKFIHRFHENFCIKFDRTATNGWEIVSFPYLLEDHYNIWLEPLKYLASKKAYVSSKVGMHVHLNKESLPDQKQAITNIEDFLLNPNNYTEIFKFAGRQNPSQFAKYKRYSERDEDRNVILNLENEETLEFRLFASTLNYDKLINNLEFVKSCQELSTNKFKLQEMKTSAKRKFPDLYKELDANEGPRKRLRPR
jgi:hypothetical protein